MTAPRYSPAPGETPPLPSSVPLVQVWRGPVDGWRPVPQEDWPTDPAFVGAFEAARRNPGTESRVQDPSSRLYLIRFSPCGEASPAPRTVLSGLIEYPGSGEDPRVNASRGIHEAPAHDVRTAPGTGYTDDEAGAAARAADEHARAREAQVRLYPVPFGLVPTLPEIALSVRNRLRDCPDTFPSEELREVREMLSARVATWVRPCSPDMLDRAVNIMARFAMDLIDLELLRRVREDIAREFEDDTGGGPLA